MSDYICSQKNYGHPCFNQHAVQSVGRIHLPVAPKCNIKCKYCFRRHDCANENRPGVTSRILKPAQAADLVRQVTAKDQRIKVVGIAGPGDPLANEATFETFRLIHREFPELIKCLSTNGLLLPDKLLNLLEVGVSSLTVTINALYPSTGRNIYSSAMYKGRWFWDEAAAAVLCQNQLLGVEMALKYGFRLKVNSVLIPGINERELPKLAKTLKQLGVELMNIIPLIPQADLAHLPPVPSLLLCHIRDECEQFLSQFRHCKQCRADAVGMLEQENPPHLNRD